MALYRLKAGKKHFVTAGGVRRQLNTGETVELSDAQASGLADRFERVGGIDASQPSGVGAKLPGVPGDKPAPEDKAVREALDGTVADAADAIADMDEGQVRSLLSYEVPGKNRKGVVDAANKRLTELAEEG